VQRKTFLTGVALCLATLGAARAGDDITMQGLDDPSDVARVIAAVDQELRSRDAEARNGRAASRSDPAAPSVASGEATSEAVPEPDELQTVLDREEQSEGELEDFDVPEDITVPDEEEE
jgi:hypothetical protein